MRLLGSCLAVLALLVSLNPATACLQGAAQQPAAAPEARIMERSLLNPGDPSRLLAVMAKARSGKSTTVAVIGGSITAGASATKPEFRYGDRILAWWKENFPKAHFEYVNAGIGATGSNYGALRAGRDLLNHSPDMVVVEYAVNDPNIREFAVTLEGLLRQILKQPQRPAVMMVFMMTNTGTNAQEWHSKVGEHYGIPMISYRDALWPEISSKQMAAGDVFSDQVHPNDRGHGYVAAFVTHYLDSLLKTKPSRRSAENPLPAPLFSDLYEHTHLMYGNDLQPTLNSGWIYDAAGNFWAADKPGSVLEADVDGREVNLLAFRIKGPMGRARVTVDSEKPVVLEGWFDQTWGGYTFTEVVAHDLAAGRHRVRIELLEEKSEGSTGHGFRVFGLGTAGSSR